MRAGRTPRSILTLRRVAPGTSGGVTLAGILGALAVGLSFVLGSQHARQRRFFAAMASGLAGCVLDSVLGATLQALYRCPACDVVLESPRHAACGAQATLVRGWPSINNDAVNAIATVRRRPRDSTDAWPAAIMVADGGLNHDGAETSLDPLRAQGVGGRTSYW
jgi:uncharacterized membrane protein